MNALNKIILILLLLTKINSKLNWGKHIKNGSKAVNFIYSATGFWKPLRDVDYVKDKYVQGSGTHRLNTNDFLNAVNKKAYLTCRDEEGHLLGDLDLDGELDKKAKWGYAFHSHNGLKGSDAYNYCTPSPAPATCTPEYTFFYDDNYLGRIVAIAYGSDIPYGLANYKDSVKWSILDGRNGPDYLFKGITNFVTAADYAIHGLYLLDRGITAASTFTLLISFINPQYDPTPTVMAYTYSNLTSNYDLALTLMFISQFYASKSINRDAIALQHMISLRSELLTRQKTQTTIYSTTAPGELTGWVNTSGYVAFRETALAILALGASGSLTFEASKNNSADFLEICGCVGCNGCLFTKPTGCTGCFDDTGAPADLFYFNEPCEDQSVGPCLVILKRYTFLGTACLNNVGDPCYFTIDTGGVIKNWLRVLTITAGASPYSRPHHIINGPSISLPQGIVDVDVFVRCYDPVNTTGNVFTFQLISDMSGDYVNISNRATTLYGPIFITASQCDGFGVNAKWFPISVPNFNLVNPYMLTFNVRLTYYPGKVYSILSDVVMVRLTYRVIQGATNTPTSELIQNGYCNEGFHYIFKSQQYNASNFGLNRLTILFQPYVQLKSNQVRSDDCRFSGYPSQLVDVLSKVPFDLCPSDTAQIGNICYNCNNNKLSADSIFNDKMEFRLETYYQDGYMVFPCSSVTCNTPKKNLGYLCLDFTTNPPNLCPNGFKFITVVTTHTCAECGNGEVAKSDGTACVTSCQSGEVLYRNTCVVSAPGVCPNGQYNLNNKCISCPLTITLDPPGLVFFSPLDRANIVVDANGNCVDNLCEKFNLITKPGSVERSICTNCTTANTGASPTKTYFDELTGKCVNEMLCPIGTVASPGNLACLKCNNIAKYAALSQSNDFIRINFDLKYCYICESTKIFSYKESSSATYYSCIETCPFDDANGFQGWTGTEKICVNCQSLDPKAKNFKGRCITTIPFAYVVTDITYGVIKECKEVNKLTSGLNCVDNCPVNTTVHEGQYYIT